MTDQHAARPGWGGSDLPGWAGRVMAVLRLISHLVAAHLLMVLGTVAGGVVLGLAPSLVAGSRLVSAAAAGDPSTSLVRDFVATWRTTFRRANLVLAPLGGAVVLILLDTWILESAVGAVRVALSAALALVAAATVVVGAFALRVLNRYDDDWRSVWRFLVLAPWLYPGAALAMLVCLGATGFLYWHLPAVAFLLGAAVPLLLTGWIADRALDRTADVAG